MDTLWIQLKEIAITLLKDPAFWAFILASLTAVFTYLKVPKWAQDVLFSILRKLFGAVAEVEVASTKKDMTSTDKKDAALAIIHSTITPKENKLLNVFGGAANVIERILPIAKTMWDIVSKFKK